MIYLEYAATNPFTKYPCSKYGQFLNPNANYAYKERKVLMDCDERIKADIGAIRLNGLNADALQQYLATKQIYIGIGHSSCAEDADYRVLKTYGLTEQEASEVIRVSFGDETTEHDLDEFVNGIIEYKEKFVR